MEIKHTLFSEAKLEGLTLRNRVIRAGCFEGMCQNSMVTDNLIEHHRRVAEGGVGMTTVSYCSVSHDGLTFEHEMWMRPEILPDLKRLTDAVHKEGAAASIQLGHSGFFTGKKVIGKRPLGASPKLCVFTLSYCREMTKQEIQEKVAAFAIAARMAKEAGFDAVEIHSGHGYLLSQFMSPWTNKRTDEYGGSLENRLRFTVEVIRSVRKAVGTGFPVIVKMNQVDGMKTGLTLDESVIAAQAFEQAGASALIPSAGFTSKVPFLMLRGNLPVKEMSNNRSDLLERIGLKLFGKFMVPYHPFEPMFLLDGAQQIRKAVSIPVIYVGGAYKLNDMMNVIDDGFGFIQIGRPTIQDPDFVKKLQSGEWNESPCDHCNRCVATMDAGGVYCVSNEIGFKY